MASPGPSPAPMPTLFAGDSVKLTGFGWRILNTDEEARVLQDSDGIERIINTDWHGARGERVIWERNPAPARPTPEQIAEWGDAVAAIRGCPGAPPAEAVERLIETGDALLTAVTGKDNA